MFRPIPVTILSDNASSFYPHSLGWSNPDALPFVNATAADESRSLILIQVRDYVRFSPNTSSGDLLAQLTEEMVERIRGDKALLVLDFSNEGPAFQKEMFDGLHGLLAERLIPRSKVLLLSQNRALKAGYTQCYGPGTMKFGIHDYFVKLLIAGMDQRLSANFETAQEVASYAPGVDDGAKDFLCMNATPRWHRILAYRYLVKSGFANKGLLSFHGANPHNPKATEIQLATLPPIIPQQFGGLIDSIETWMPAEPIRFDRDVRTGNDLAQSLETWAYRQSLYSIVTESDFFEGRIDRVTEKVLKAASLGHPFIVIGNARSISFMAELGFQTFSSVIDHSYDQEHDPALRMRAIFLEIERQQEWIAQDRSGWIAKTRECAEFNFRHARNGLQQRYYSLIEKPLLDRFSQFIDSGDIW